VGSGFRHMLPTILIAKRHLIPFTVSLPVQSAGQNY